MSVRLQKVLAEAGIASRRGAEELIKQGRVLVNGKTVTTLGTKVDRTRDSVKVDGKLIVKPQRKTYILLYKPSGVLTSMKAQDDRETVMGLLRNVKTRVFPVGRLDFDTEGVLLLTNDGDLAHRLMHPMREIKKVYLAKVSGIPTEKTLKKLATGVQLDSVKTSPCAVSIHKVWGKNCWLKIVLHEGKYHQVKRMCRCVGHPVRKLKRVKFASLDLKGMRAGQFRFLGESEVNTLKKLAGSPEVI